MLEALRTRGKDGAALAWWGSTPDSSRVAMDVNMVGARGGAMRVGVTGSRVKNYADMAEAVSAIADALE